MVADAITVLMPLGALADEVTCRVVEPLAPGARVKLVVAKAPDHPAGTEAERVKLPVLQLVLSLLVTETV